MRARRIVFKKISAVNSNFSDNCLHTALSCYFSFHRFYPLSEFLRELAALRSAYSTTRLNGLVLLRAKEARRRGETVKESVSFAWFS